jgi:flagellar basal-body rod protein FlgG
VSDAYYVGAIGLGTQQRALDAIANNIANINTGGFKRSDVRFTDVVASAADRNTPIADLASTPASLAGVALDTRMMLNEQGALQRTGAAMDIAIDGAGFIPLMGPDGQTMLWRGGALKIGENGMLANTAGMALKAGITVPRDATALTIATDGMVTAVVPGSADAVEIGRIELVRVDDASAMERIDGAIYRIADSDVLDTGPAGQDGTGLMIQGSVERSNVALTDEMVRMMLVQRAYAANAQIVQAADQLMGIANGLRR